MIFNDGAGIIQTTGLKKAVDLNLRPSLSIEGNSSTVTCGPLNQPADFQIFRKPVTCYRQTKTMIRCTGSLAILNSLVCSGHPYLTKARSLKETILLFLKDLHQIFPENIW